jgi:hypothetical protein
LHQASGATLVMLLNCLLPTLARCSVDLSASDTPTLSKRARGKRNAD